MIIEHSTLSANIIVIGIDNDDNSASTHSTILCYRQHIKYSFEVVQLRACALARARKLLLSKMVEFSLNGIGFHVGIGCRT